MNDFQKICKKYGKEKIFLYIGLRPIKHFPLIGRIMGLGYTSSNDPKYDVICAIDESRYKIDKGYKVTFKSIDERFGKRHYYQSDLETLIREKHVIILVAINDEFIDPNFIDSEDLEDIDDPIDTIIISAGVKHICCGKYHKGQNHISFCNMPFNAMDEGSTWEAFEDHWLSDINCPECKEQYEETIAMKAYPFEDDDDDDD